jgi:GTP-binding protein
VEAGRGGDGALSFRREANVPKGGPDGGDGGRGGDVVLVADPALRDLSALARRRRLRAGRGGSGGGANRHGADGDHVELQVPVGTQVFDEDGELLADLASPGARALAGAGGRGGRGNRRFATPPRRTPRFAETGLPGERRWIELRLKLLADGALVGLPNAGKSSLLRRISNAKPKVADYPFTTLVPVLGTVDAADGSQLTVVDVPGLIEGASEGAGLGHEFLAHLERARLLLHVVDVAAGDPVAQLAAIDQELTRYGAGLDERPQIVVLNKIDLLAEVPPFEADDERVLRAIPVSAATGAGIPELRRTLFEVAPPMRESASAESELADFLVYRPRPPHRRRYRILRTESGFRVAGTSPDRAELEEALRQAGARRGAEVEVGDETFELE